MPNLFSTFYYCHSLCRVMNNDVCCKWDTYLFIDFISRVSQEIIFGPMSFMLLFRKKKLSNKNMKIYGLRSSRSMVMCWMI